MKYAFAGDRKISCNILKFLIEKGHSPSALFVSAGKRASHSQELIDMVDLPEALIFKGSEFRTEENMSMLKSLGVDYVFGIHFPYIIPSDLLEIPKYGFLNLHPAYLPFNKGWNTPSWAIYDGTPFGATLHLMTEKLDEGDIISQAKLAVEPYDTANTLYKRALALEENVFKEAFESLVDFSFERTPQTESGTSYSKKDLKNIQEIDLEKEVQVETLINKLRALTTSELADAAYYTKDGKEYSVQITIQPKDTSSNSAREHSDIAEIALGNMVKPAIFIDKLSNLSDEAYFKKDGKEYTIQITIEPKNTPSS